MKSDPKIIVTCDECGTDEEYGLTVLARGWDDRDLEDSLRRAGWTIVDDNTHICPECTEAQED